MVSLRIALPLLLLAAACGDDVSAATTIGASGGEVSIDGVTLRVPPGALSEDTQIRITRTDEDPPGFDPISPVYRFEPLGLEFDVPAEVTFDISEMNGLIYWSRADGGYSMLETTIGPAFARADVEHFSRGFVDRVDDDMDAGDATMDSSVPDTSVPDTAVPDTAVPDTAVPDTSVPDTSVPDAEMDTGVDSGPDAEADTGMDTGTDTGTDAEVDTGTDAEMDSGADATDDADEDAGDADPDA